MAAIYRRELRSYFTGIIGYLFLAVMLFFIGLYTALIVFYQGYAYFEYALNNVSFILLLVIPVLTMKSIAEEKRQKTIDLLYSLPVSMTDVVLGKFFALATVYLLPCLIICIYPLIMSLFGSVSLLTAYSSILAFFLVGCALIAVGVFISSLTENQIVAAVLSFGAVLISYLMPSLAGYVASTAYASFLAFALMIILLGIIVYFLTKSSPAAIGTLLICTIPLCLVYIFRSSALEGSFLSVINSLSIFDRFSGFVNGIFDITALIYLLSVTVLFLFFTVQALERRRWN